MALERFYWLVDDMLAGCSRPGGREGMRAITAVKALATDLHWLRERGIGALLTLTETSLDAETLASYQIEALHIPIDDLTAPTPEQFVTALAFIDRQRIQGCAVAVHCLMGQGRTGSILAAYLIRAGATPQEALRKLRVLCPGAVENPSQEYALDAFATRRDWII